MKFPIVILAVISAAFAEFTVKNVAEIAAVQAECVKEVGLSEGQTQNIKNYVFPDEVEVRKYLLCSVKKLGIFNEESGYNAENVAKQFKLDLDEAEVLAIAQNCSDKNEQGSPVDVWAYRGNQCLLTSKVGEHVIAYLKKAQADAKKQ